MMQLKKGQEEHRPFTAVTGIQMAYIRMLDNIIRLADMHESLWKATRYLHENLPVLKNLREGIGHLITVCQNDVAIRKDDWGTFAKSRRVIDSLDRLIDETTEVLCRMDQAVKDLNDRGYRDFSVLWTNTRAVVYSS